MKLLQIALVAQELEPVRSALCDALGIEVAYRDPSVEMFGLHNVVMPVGETFLEIVSPIREGTTAGRYLKRRGGDGGYMVILQTGDLAPHRARLEAADVRIAWEGSAAPKGDDGPRWTGLHLHPRDTGGALLSLDHPEPADSWIAAGPDWRDHIRTDVVRALAVAELQSNDPDRLGRRWSEVLGLPLEKGEIGLERGRLRFVPIADGRPEGLRAIELVASDPGRTGESLEIGGVELRLCRA